MTFKQVTNINTPILYPYAAIMVDTQRCKMTGIFHLLRYIRHLSSRFFIECLRYLHIDGFVRSYLIIRTTECVKSLLLLLYILRWRTCRFILQCPVHSLMPAILLWLAGLNTLRDDSQRYPPHRQPGQPTDRFRGKRYPIITSDTCRESIAFKYPLKYCPGIFVTGTGHTVTAQQIAAVMIHHR